MAVVVFGLVSISGCGLRVGQPQPSAIAASSLEQARNKAAVHANALVLLSGRVLRHLNAADPSYPMVTEITKGTFDQYVALGGVHDAATPTGSAAASPVSYSGTDLHALVDALVTEHGLAFDAAVTSENDGFRRLMTRIATWRALIAEKLAPAALAGDIALVSTNWAQLDPALSQPEQIVTALDSIGYGLEVVAARSDEALRSRARDAAAALRTLASDLAVAAKVGTNYTDTRLVAYQLPPVNLGDAKAAVAQTAQWFEKLADEADHLLDTEAAARGWLISFMTWARAQQIAWGGSALSAVPTQTALTTK